MKNKDITIVVTSSRGLVVRITDSELEGRTVGSIPISHSGIFQPKVGSYPEWACYGPNGKTAATQLSLIHFMDALVRVLLGRERKRCCPDQYYRCLLFPGLVDAMISPKKRSFDEL